MRIKDLINLKQYMSKVMGIFSDAYRWMRQLDNERIRIEEINTSTGRVILYSSGIRTILKLSIAEAIEDPNILCRLMPVQACWLGYYSSLTRAQSDKILDSGGGLLLRHKKGHFKILSLDRKGVISYLDTRDHSVKYASPLAIAQNQSIVGFFDSSQACYIGILAGIDKSKQKDCSLMLSQKPLLRLVK